jgi:hypothetical protein
MIPNFLSPTDTQYFTRIGQLSISSQLLFVYPFCSIERAGR